MFCYYKNYLDVNTTDTDRTIIILLEYLPILYKKIWPKKKNKNQIIPANMPVSMQLLLYII